MQKTENNDGVLITYGPFVETYIDKLPAQIQKKISKDLVTCFTQTLANLARMQIQSFWSEEQSHMLNMLSSDRFPISIGEYSLTVRCDFCKMTAQLSWEVIEIMEFQHENVIHVSKMRDGQH